MKNLIAIVVTIITVATTGYSQFQIGFTGSYSQSLTKSSEYLAPRDNQSYAFKLKVVDQSNTRSLGLTSRYIYKNIFMTAGAEYRNSKYTLELETFTSESPSQDIRQFTESSNQIYVPVSAGFIFNDFTFAVGPQFTFNIKDNSPLAEITDIVDQGRQFYSGFHFDTGYKFGKYVHAFARYEMSMQTVGDLHYYNGKATKLNSSLDFFTIGLNFYL